MPVTVVNSIVAGNTSEIIEEDRAAAALAVRADDCDFPVGTLGGNLEGDTTCGFRGAGDKQNTDPKLAALAANGGLTRTHALAADSPAVNMAGAAKCLATDQRGMARVAATCDSGAYELVPPGTQPSAPAGGALGEQASNCLSDRRFKIRLRVPRGEEVRKAIVKVDGKRVKVQARQAADRDRRPARPHEGALQGQHHAAPEGRRQGHRRPPLLDVHAGHPLDEAAEGLRSSKFRGMGAFQPPCADLPSRPSSPCSPSRPPPPPRTRTART